MSTLRYHWVEDEYFNPGVCFLPLSPPHWYLSFSFLMVPFWIPKKKALINSIHILIIWWTCRGAAGLVGRENITDSPKLPSFVQQTYMHPTPLSAPPLHWHTPWTFWAHTTLQHPTAPNCMQFVLASPTPCMPVSLFTQDSLCFPLNNLCICYYDSNQYCLGCHC